MVFTSRKVNPLITYNTMNVISFKHLSTSNISGFQPGMNYTRLEEEYCWQAEPNLAYEFKDR